MVLLGRWSNTGVIYWGGGSGVIYWGGGFTGEVVKYRGNLLGRWFRGNLLGRWFYWGGGQIQG